MINLTLYKESKNSYENDPNAILKLQDGRNIY